jgi:curved DNA-binding protein CbpA
MEIQEALRILDLPDSATEEDIINAHRELIKIHHPDVNPNSNLSYNINQAKDLLIQKIKSNNEKSLALVITDALVKYKQFEKWEQEKKNEIDLLILENSRKPRNRIAYLRNLSATLTFFTVVFGYFLSSTNNYLEINKKSETVSSEFIKRALSKDPSIFKEIEKKRMFLKKSVNKRDSVQILRNINILQKYDSEVFFDSIYLNNPIYKKRVDDLFKEYQNESDEKVKQTKSSLILIGLIGSIFVAFVHLKLKKYDDNVEAFKLQIDNKSKLRSILLLKSSNIDSKPKLISESELLNFIHDIFFDSSGQFLKHRTLINLGRNLELHDLERILLLKFEEKDFIKEDGYDNQTGDTIFKILI